MDFYLILDIIMISGPLLLSFDKKVAFWRSCFAVLAATAVVILVFGIWDVYMSAQGVWSFNPAHTGTIRWGGMPPGEWLFFFCVPYACIFILACVRVYFKEKVFKVRRWPWFVIAALFVAGATLFWGKLYTASVFFSVAILLVGAAILIPKTLASRNFWLAMAITYIPFLIFNSILTGLPVIQYDDSQNLAIRIGTIPLEDFFYSFSMLLLGMLFYDIFARFIPRLGSKK